MRHHAVDCLALFNSEQARLRAINEPETTPAWLPEGALAHEDFTSAQFYLDGAVADNSTSFPGAIAAEGYSLNGIVSREVPLSGTKTVVIEVDDTAANTIVKVDGAGSPMCAIAPYADQWNAYDDLNDLYSGAWTAGGINRVAFTVGPGKLSISGNGAAVATAALNPDVGTLSRLLFDPGTNAFLRVLTIYDAQADAALPALSALS